MGSLSGPSVHSPNHSNERSALRSSLTHPEMQSSYRGGRDGSSLSESDFLFKPLVHGVRLFRRRMRSPFCEPNGGPRPGRVLLGAHRGFISLHQYQDSRLSTWVVGIRNCEISVCSRYSQASSRPFYSDTSHRFSHQTRKCAFCP